MAAEAEAAREARAKVIAAEGEQKASRALREASEVIGDSPAALQLRYLQVSSLLTSTFQDCSVNLEKNMSCTFYVTAKEGLSTWILKWPLKMHVALFYLDSSVNIENTYMHFTAWILEWPLEIQVTNFSTWILV